MGDEKTVELAIAALQGAIRKLHARASKRRELDVRYTKLANKLVRHIDHLLHQLVVKRKSLGALIDWFTEEWKRVESKLSDVHHTQAILEHALAVLVRCQDGLVILTSGECRHPEDVKEAKKTVFGSKLGTLTARSDGYTKLYSGGTYSGYGWDEYANESVGLQVRLSKALRQCHKDPWRYLEDTGCTELLETLLDKHESEVKRLQQELQALKRQISSDITKRLAKPIQFSTEDKMERLEVLVPKKGPNQKISLSRRADNFQIVGSSVLPSDLDSSQEWGRLLALKLHSEGTGKKAERKKGTSGRKRLYIEETDSEDEDGATREARQSKNATASQKTTVTASTGLLVRIKASHDTEATSDSVATIKAQMGIDGKGLETAREGLDQEMRQQESLAQSRFHYELEKIRKFQLILERAEGRNEIERDDNEIWDARECLRQAYMELGNESLWWNSSSGIPRSLSDIEQATDCFEKASKLVLAQQKEHERSSSNCNDRTDESREIGWNLRFLKAQATVNTGISLFERSKAATTGSHKKYLLRAANKLEEIRAIIRGMRHEATEYEKSSMVDPGAKLQIQLHCLELDKLGQLASRWLGSVLWSMKPTQVYDKAIDAFRDSWNAASDSQSPSTTSAGIEVQESQLEIAAEAIFATSMLADLAYGTMQRFNRRERCDKGHAYVDIIELALQKQQEIQQRLEDLESAEAPRLSRVVRNFRADSELPAAESTREYLEQVQRWWRDCLRQSNELDLLKTGRLQAAKTAATSSIATREPASAAAAPPKRYIISNMNQGRRPKRTNMRSGGTSHSFNIQEASSDADGLQAIFDEAEVVRPPKRFRKWGDDLLTGHMQTLAGGPEASVLPLPYPSTAPELPEAFKDVFEKQKSILIVLH